LARRALLTARAGRLETAAGRLVVLDRVLPDVAAAVRSRAHLFDRFPRVEVLSGLGRRRTSEPVLVLVDDVDVFASEDELARRWDLLAALAGRGVTVVAGAAREPRGADGITWTTLPLIPEGPVCPATEEAAL
jgi:hypothetical protein